MFALCAIGYLALFWSDLPNNILGGGILAAWKQVIFVAFWCLALLAQKSIWERLLVIFGLGATLLLIVRSIIGGISSDIAIYNSFLYFSWIPAYIISRAGLFLYMTRRFGSLWMPFVLISALGLFIDLSTDAFAFVSRQGGIENGVTTSYLLENNIAKRVGFFFVTSTMVVPIVAAPAFLYLSVPRSSLGRSLIGIAIVFCGAFTGSLSSLAVGATVGLAIIASGGSSSLKQMLVVFAISLSAITFAILFVDESLLQVQFERILDNTFSDSEANVGRVMFWQQAFRDIVDFSPIQHILGAGLGATNDNKGNFAMYGHGESSFLQAYIEAGIVGTLGRVLPFLVMMRHLLRHKFSLEQLPEYAWLASAFTAVALAPTFGNLPFQAVLGLMIAKSNLNLNRTAV